MVTPILISSGGDVLSFDTVEAAQEYLEPVDVMNDEHLAFDAEGQALHLSVDRDLTIAAQREVVRIRSTGTYDRAGLERILTDYLDAVRRNVNPYVIAPIQLLTLQQLVPVVHRYAKVPSR